MNLRSLWASRSDPASSLQGVASMMHIVVAPYVKKAPESSAFVLVLEAKRQSFFMVRLVISFRCS